MSCNEWKKLTIDDICTVTDCQHKTAPVVDYITEYKMLRTSNIRNGKIDRVNVKYVNKDIYDKWSARGYLEIDDVILTREAPMGEVGIIKTKDKFFLGQRMLQLKAKKALISPDFLYYSLLSPLIQNQIRINEGMGSVVSNIRIPLLKKMNINIPNLEEQKKITDILSCIDEKIELNNEMNKTLEEMAQSIFKRWFVDFEFPNEDGEPYKSSGGEMVDSELGMIPKGWEVKELSQLVNIITKSEKPFENEDILYEHFSIPALDSNKLPILEFGNSISSNKYKIDNDCILISKLNPNNKRIWNPYCNTSNSICSTEFIVYKAINNYPKSYIYEIINSDEFTKFLVANATGSTGSRQRVKPKDTLGYKIVLPTIDKIIEIDKILSPIHKNIQLNTQESNTILQIRNTLLPKLMSGEIKVN
mgnify:CR=1 FL=1